MYNFFQDEEFFVDLRLDAMRQQVRGCQSELCDACGGIADHLQLVAIEICGDKVDPVIAIVC